MSPAGRNKRDAEFEVLDGMRLIQDLVVEADVAVWMRILETAKRWGFDAG